MWIIVAILLIIVIIIQLFLNNKVNKTRREMSGLPIASSFPLSRTITLKSPTNYMMVVSTNCTVCQRIFKELQHKESLSNLYLVFKNPKQEVDDFVKQNPHLNHAHIVTSIPKEDLFIKTTPLTYQVNQQGVIEDKMSVVSLKELSL
ncbi:hypothetical protein DOS77_02410 [Staphylococcus felis]|uniref:Uncharacterized protein n=1 Tax=Staphylococcus felis TaxID=46127 RepID=A0ABS0QMT9_9STAP|nr:hypothetical protein [Staphylococcus felis]AVP36131.1 hypothetical protein C7J90_03880 [Staphylococcus felis]MBH9580539.1 hypothetical protein [Staphylococcus felis]MDM8328141.1 hypothetical protein [Staphylococcus felis]MDQ7193919.1 hypothetical protein [Staphylococcus felis]PNZ34568.1 hypothetical protein CD143_08580 [Staphylococcus felis]